MDSGGSAAQLLTAATSIAMGATFACMLIPRRHLALSRIILALLRVDKENPRCPPGRLSAEDAEALKAHGFRVRDEWLRRSFYRMLPNYFFG